jgi:excisionase family DNA binding protein
MANKKHKKRAVGSGQWAMGKIDPLTVEQAAHELGISRQRVTFYIREKRLKAEKFGRAYLIRRSDLEGLERGEAGRPPLRG